MSQPTKQTLWCDRSIEQFNLFIDLFIQNNPDRDIIFDHLRFINGDKFGLIKYICWAWGVGMDDLYLSDFDIMNEFVLKTTGVNIKLKIVE